MKVTMTRNQEKNGIELSFTEKPSADVIEQMKSQGFRYHRQGRYWYARFTPSREALALSLADQTPVEKQEQTEQFSSTTFFPLYDAVDGYNIYRNAADVLPRIVRKGYFADVHAMIITHHDHVRIIDLTDALVPGKSCIQVSVNADGYNNNTNLLNGLETFRDVYTRYFVERAIPDQCQLYTSELESMRVFTPFKKVQPIKKPSKWTLPHVWKAILSGQVFIGQIDQKTSDDYAYDAHVNFFEGRNIHLPTFAKDLIESPSGWWVHPDNETDGVVQLSINCHSFDLRTVWFDEKCDWAESNRRTAARDEERDSYNQGLLAQTFSTNEDELETGACYEISYLEKNHNTGHFEIAKATVTKQSIQDGEYHCCPLVSCEKYIVEADQLYRIDGINSQTAAIDARIISLVADQYVVTGKALNELLAEGAYLSSIKRHFMSFDETERDLRDYVNGRITVLLGPKIDYAQSLDRLLAEKARVA